jgi:fucose 4-O-acetylase-like acetyltransferase
MARDRYLQALRGLAIAAVVLIHCLPQCVATVALRPFLNFSVALFLFLSGLLTDEVKIGGCSYSFVNWEMLSVRPNRGMLTPSH